MALVSPDETTFPDLDKVPDDRDLWVKECGMFRETPDGHPILSDELWAEERDHQTTFDQTLEQVRTVAPTAPSSQKSRRFTGDGPRSTPNWPTSTRG
ncbi:hypothetical protein [Halorussus pelagicus]|uniref:hypothetical protein n=1 Tax=Halorussus pelagicus TaxID=2505977 RepID=UPI000FFB638B|nr:hypothetical protein [Halorussus pelagicus]